MNQKRMKQNKKITFRRGTCVQGDCTKRNFIFCVNCSQIQGEKASPLGFLILLLINGRIWSFFILEGKKIYILFKNSYNALPSQ